MVKVIRANQKIFLAGLMILSMITFLVNKGSSGDRSASDTLYATIDGKPVYRSEAAQAHAELAALKSNIDFSSHMDEQGELRDPQAQLMRALISATNTRPDWYLMLRHEANAAGEQVSKDDIETVMTNYTHDLVADDDADLATRAGVTQLLKIIARYEQIAQSLKVSKPVADLQLVGMAEKIQMDLIQLKAADFLDKAPPPTTQQLQDQFMQFAAEVPHKPTPTTNPFGFGYRLPVRATVQTIYVPREAATAAVAATKFKFPAPDWEVQARKYYLAHLDEFPTTLPVGPTTMPAGPQPFAIVHDKILTKIRDPLVTRLMDQVQAFVSSTLNIDWQSYSVYVNGPQTGAEPISSLGVAYNSFDYLNKLVEKVQAKFQVTIVASQTPEPFSQEQITTLPLIGTAVLAEDVAAQSNDYLDMLTKKPPAAPAVAARPSAAISAADGTSAVYFRLSQVLPSQPAPNLASVQAQVIADLRIAAAYNIALAQAKIIVDNIKDRPLFLVADAHHPVIHIDHLSMQDQEVPQITPDLSTATRPFLDRAFQLLGSYSPTTNRNPAETIELPDNGRVFAAQLSFVDVDWNSESYFYRTLQARQAAERELSQQILRDWLFDYDAVTKRTGYKLATKNASN